VGHLNRGKSLGHVRSTDWEVGRRLGRAACSEERFSWGKYDVKHRTQLLKICLLSATIFTSVVFTLPALAQSAAVEEADENAIVVTATRRSTTIQDTPINISAIGSEQLQNLQVDDLKDLGAITPGVTIVDTGPRGAGNIIARGLTATSGGGSGAIGSYLGDVPLYLDFKLIDIQRVEVLLGPQGTLYGKGTLGGAIRYIPGRPDNEFSYTARGRAYTVAHSDNFGYSGEATINVPLIKDVLSFRSATGYYSDPGFIDYTTLLRTPGVSLAQPGPVSNPLGTAAQRAANFTRAEDLNYERTISTRNQLGLNVGDIKGYFTYAYQQTKTGGAQSTTAGIVGEGKYESAKRYREPGTRGAHLYSAEIEVPLFGIATLNSATAWTTQRSRTVGDVTDLLLDLDYGYELFPAFSGYTTGTSKTDQFNQEIRIVSTHGGPINWVLGGFYNNVRARSDGLETLPGYAAYRNINRPDNAEYVSFTNTRNAEKAVFGEATLQATSKLQFTGGLRYFTYDAFITGGSDTPLTASGRRRMPYPSLTIDPSRIRSGSTNADGFVWKANTSYKFSSTLMAYFTYSTGYRIGGVNRVVPCIVPIDTTQQNLCALPDELSFDPDKTKNIELGMRGEFFDRRLSATVSIFQVKWDGIQLGSSTFYGNIGITANAGAAKSQGVDMSFSARPTNRLTISGNYSYLDAKLTVDALGLISVKRGSPQDGLVKDGKVDALAGDRLPGSAKHTGSLSATYTLPLGSNELGLNWTATYTGNRLTEVGARGGGEKMPGFLLNRASVMYRTDKFDIGLYATNIFDVYSITGVGQDLTRRYFVNDGVVARYYTRTIGQPRVIGIETRIKY
jgi:iron complex outermembrane receptor protein